MKMFGFMDKLEKKIKENALVTLKKAYIHLWGERGFDTMLKPPLFKIEDIDLALSEDDKFILELIEQGKTNKEILEEAKKRGLDANKIKLILTKLNDRDKIRELIKEKYNKEEDLDEWHTEVWAGKNDKGQWVFFRYRVPKGQTLADKLSFIKYRYLDVGILIRLNLAINSILLILLFIMALGYQYPIIIYYLQQIVTTRDMVWMSVVIGLLFIIVNIKLNEEVLYANFLFLNQETLELPVRIGEDVLVTKVLTVYLYQSDQIPPVHVDVLLINTEKLARHIKESILREFLNQLKENVKLLLRVEHLREELRAHRNLLDEYKKSIDEAYLLGLAIGVKQRKAREYIFRPSSNIPIKEILRAIVILGALGIIGYALSAIIKNPLGVYILFAMLAFIAILVIVILIKTATVKTEYQIVKSIEGV